MPFAISVFVRKLIVLLAQQSCVCKDTSSCPVIYEIYHDADLRFLLQEIQSVVDKLILHIYYPGHCFLNPAAGVPTFGHRTVDRRYLVCLILQVLESALNQRDLFPDPLRCLDDLSHLVRCHILLPTPYKALSSHSVSW